jgi:hypothetical protein
MLTAGCGSHGPDEAAPSNKPLHAAANFDLSLPGYVACSSRILEGDVLQVIDGRPGRMLVTMRVDHWVKPATGPRTFTLSLVDIAAEDVYERWAPGTHLRLQVDVDPTVLPSWQLSAKTFTAIEDAVPESRTLECPYGPS